LNGVPFERQKVIQKDDFVAIVDFFLPPNLVIEIGGDYIVNDKQRLKAMQREQSLNTMGYTVVRISNKQVKEVWKAFLKQRHILGPKSWIISGESSEGSIKS